MHTYNAMRPFSHRDPGMLGAIMTDPEVTAEIIADGVHVAGRGHSGADWSAKGFDTVLLVSDGIAATGMRDGNYRLGKFRSEREGWRRPELRKASLPGAR